MGLEMQLHEAVLATELLQIFDMAEAARVYRGEATPKKHAKGTDYYTSK
jgi:hypothetical protein